MLHKLVNLPIVAVLVFLGMVSDLIRHLRFAANRRRWAERMRRRFERGDRSLVYEYDPDTLQAELYPPRKRAPEP